jgi:hypothetical protein
MFYYIYFILFYTPSSLKLLAKNECIYTGKHVYIHLFLGSYFEIGGSTTFHVY